MSELAKDPSKFLDTIRKNTKLFRKKQEERRGLQDKSPSDESAMLKLAKAVDDELKLSTSVVDAYEELDEWLEEGGDAPSQWIEKKPEF